MSRTFPLPADADSIKAVEGRNYVASVIKACKVVEALDNGKKEYSLGEVAEIAGLGKTTTHRLLSSLLMAGWVERGSHEGYRLSLRVLKLSHAVQRQFSIRDEAMPYLREIAGRFGDTAFLMVPTDGGGIIVEMVEGDSPIKVNTVSVGTLLPYHAGGGPSVMAAWSAELREQLFSGPREKFTSKTEVSREALETKFERIRLDGYVFAEDDLNTGVAVISAPVFKSAGELVCTLSLGGAAQRFGVDRRPVLIDGVKAACAVLSKQLGN